MEDNKTTLVKNLGNVTEDSEVTFEYRLKPIKELLAMEDIDLTEIKQFPFQAQISYTALDGSKCVRVLTNHLAASDDKASVNHEADFGILGVNAIQQASKQAMQGDVLGAQVYAKAQNRFIRKEARLAGQSNAYEDFAYNNCQQYDMMQQHNLQSENVTSFVP